ncbi:MBG domain-containing protein [Flammeovirga kamogawensis]|uniref:T9SS type A sorting domain-containing protein n=1 Tax=Flammeovirga kamogawensis TaxID=373891 RepID=A0ABX8H4L1_9BACT|nr:MBG domain-containing protein [Flammeovirga kamogawensis]MBB6460476.1 hypothetical protein [Flammeovirga kamogawensis]QWG10282.1 T9SS type A sorting domain-containing protein [Flammeovirga kamogawensis]TRX64730.1 T9SS type A sorting domain-containing protein [Flammeovirga kamogawensis]
MKKIILNFFTIALLFSFTMTTYAEIVTTDEVIYVDATNGVDTNDGSEFNPLKTLTAALGVDYLKQEVPTTIYVKGVFTTDSDIVLKGTNNLSSRYKVTIKNWDSSQATFQGDGTFGARFMKIENSDVVFEGVTIKDFGVADNGGALFLQWNGTLTLESCNFINNRATDSATASKLIGGGAIHSAGFLYVYNSYFGENYAEDRGAAISVAFKEFELQNSLVYNNYTNGTGDKGGAAVFVTANDKNNAVVTMNNNTIVGNYSTNTAGGASGLMFLDHSKGPTTTILGFRNNLIFNFVYGLSQAWQVDIFANKSRIITTATNFENNIFNIKNNNVIDLDESNLELINITDGGDPAIVLSSVKDQLQIGTGLEVDLNGVFTLPQNEKGVYYLPIYDGSTAINSGYDNNINDINGNSAIGGSKDVGNYEFTGNEATITLTSATEIDYSNAEHTPTFKITDKDGVDITEDVALTVTYNDVNTKPKNAGVYTVKAALDLVETGYFAKLETTITIKKAKVVLEEIVTTPVYTGEAIDYQYKINYNAGGEVLDEVNVDVTYDGESTVPSAANTYAVEATINDTNYESDASLTSTFTIEQANVEFTVGGDLSMEYNGASQMPTVTISPAEVTVEKVISGDNDLGIDVGSYTLTSTVADPNYKGENVTSYTITKATAEIKLSELVHVGDDTEKSASYTVIGVDNEEVDVTVNISYTLDGDPVVSPKDVGEYVVTAVIDDINYEGEATADFVISDKMLAVVVVDESPVVYNGNPQEVVYSITDIDGNAITSDGVSITYNGLDETPTDAGEYEVVINVSDDNYLGISKFNYSIGKKEVTITKDVGVLTYTGDVQLPMFTISEEGLNAVSELTIGDGTTAGEHQLKVTLNEVNYAAEVLIDYSIEKAVLEVSLTNLNYTYDGTGKEATVVLAMGDVDVDVMYEESIELPVNAGEYTVKASINDSNYQGETSETLVIEKAEATIVLSDLSVDYDGTEKNPSYTTSVEGLSVDFSYDGDNASPIIGGEYAVIATINDLNYKGSLAATFVINKIEASVTFTTLTANYNGESHAAVAESEIGDVEFSYTYNDQDVLPVAVGSYKVVATINDPSYFGSVEGNFIVEKGIVELTISNLEFDYDGEVKEVTITAGKEVEGYFVTYNGATTLPHLPGEYSVAVDIVDPNYKGFAMETLVINEGNSADPLSVDEQQLSMDIFPNPSQGEFTVKLINSAEAQLSVITLSGKEVFSTTVQQQSHITLPTNIHGVVVVKIVSDNVVSTQKLLIK